MYTLYKEKIINFYNDKTNSGVLLQPHFDVSTTNPLCGDRIRLTALCDDFCIIDIKFMASGCVLSQASIAMLSHYVKLKKIEDILQLNASFMQNEIGISLGPTRLRCVLLALDALFLGIKQLNRGK